MSDEVAALHSGPEHCDWESATFVYLAGRQYIADPERKVGASTAAGYQADATLPADATDTGYRSGKTRIYVTADKYAVYLVRGRKAERLPLVTPMIGCA